MKTQSMNLDYSAFEGWKLEGRPSVVTEGLDHIPAPHRRTVFGQHLKGPVGELPQVIIDSARRSASLGGSVRWTFN